LFSDDSHFTVELREFGRKGGELTSQCAREFISGSRPMAMAVADGVEDTIEIPKDPCHYDATYSSARVTLDQDRH
jgi:hypothetical protein